MERLSSCYFCGTAVDAPLEDHPVVPASGGGDGLVVTLCPTCRRKLATIVERVTEAEGGVSLTEPTAEAVDAGAAADDPARPVDDAEILADEDDAAPAGTPAAAESEAVDPGDDREAKSADAAIDDAAVSVLEYNRVMRLLENRELPVERVAFRELATSAYELAPGTVDAVLDAAIDGGLLAEDEEGRLVRAPDRDPDDGEPEGDSTA